MPELKLQKLPDRTRVKHSIVVTPHLEQKLHDYARRYQEAYGEAESVDTLIPFMLEAFLNSDRNFHRGRKVRKHAGVT